MLTLVWQLIWYVFEDWIYIVPVFLYELYVNIGSQALEVWLYNTLKTSKWKYRIDISNVFCSEGLDIWSGLWMKLQAHVIWWIHLNKLSRLDHAKVVFFNYVTRHVWRNGEKSFASMIGHYNSAQSLEGAFGNPVSLVTMGFMLFHVIASFWLGLTGEPFWQDL